MKNLIVTLLLVFPTVASAAPRCYQLSMDGNLWSRTPERLCVEENNGGATITLETGLLRTATIATFQLDLLLRARCMDCNSDVYGVSNPSNSIFNELRISFDGHLDGTGKESGTVDIGQNRFYYRN